MAKGSRGGQRAGGSLSAGGGSLLNQQNQQSQQPQIDNTQTASDFSTDQFESLVSNDRYKTYYNQKKDKTQFESLVSNDRYKTNYA